MGWPRPQPWKLLAIMLGGWRSHFGVTIDVSYKINYWWEGCRDLRPAALLSVVEMYASPAAGLSRLRSDYASPIRGGNHQKSQSRGGRARRLGQLTWGMPLQHALLLNLPRRLIALRRLMFLSFSLNPSAQTWTSRTLGV